MGQRKLSFPPSQAAQTVVEGGAGRVIKVTLSNNEHKVQVVSFYDRDGRTIIDYEVRPLGFPYTLNFTNRLIFTFKNGLKIRTGKCRVEMVVEP